MSSIQELLARLHSPGGTALAEKPAKENHLPETASKSALDANAPTPKVSSDTTEAVPVNPSPHDSIDEVLNRIAKLTGRTPPNPSQPSSSAKESTSEASQNEAFYPREPASYRDAKLSEAEVEALIVKFLLSRGEASGREIADQIKLPFILIEELLRRMKQDQLLFHRGSAPMNDYQFELTDLGRERARRHVSHCTYFGSAPVHLSDYIESVKQQSLTKLTPKPEDLERAFADLLIGPKMMARLGPAINSGRGLFLYGAPGNGKTSIAERITRAFGNTIWIPRAIGVDGEVIRLYDPNNHEIVPEEPTTGVIDERKIDKRWIRIRRPTIVVGGELTMANLEVTLNTSTGISEAPVQLKSNCGTLVIDDFGRQRMSTDELLNRWIVPLEKRYDFLNLANGKKIDVPFDQLIVFSTNLEPKQLVDDAFLRRIPYKIEVRNPTEEEFRRLFELICPKMGFEYRDEPITYLIEKHYKPIDRPFRCCQPRDLLLQIRNYCVFHNKPLEISPENFDFAAENYFAIM